MERRFVLEIHSPRPLPLEAASVGAEEGSFEDERVVPLVYTFYFKTEAEAKAKRDEILSRFPDAIEQIREEIK